jgi:hypothetical protein
MGKTGEGGIYNCVACGYGSCESMAKAIFNGLNKAENCHHYQKKRLEEDHASAKALSESLNAKIVECELRTGSLGKTMETLSVRCAEQAAVIEESAAAIENTLVAISKASQLSVGNRKRLDGHLRHRRHDQPSVHERGD